MQLHSFETLIYEKKSTILLKGEWEVNLVIPENESKVASGATLELLL